MKKREYINKKDIFNKIKNYLKSKEIIIKLRIGKLRNTLNSNIACIKVLKNIIKPISRIKKRETDIIGNNDNYVLIDIDNIKLLKLYNNKIETNDSIKEELINLEESYYKINNQQNKLDKMIDNIKEQIKQIDTETINNELSERYNKKRGIKNDY